MPTGYTAAVQSGEITTLDAFAFRCARAFDALITMRDEPLDAPIPERLEPNTDYHDKKLAEAMERLNELTKLTPEQAEFRAHQAYEEAVAAYMRCKEDKAEEFERYETMLAKVISWSVPEKLADLKKFMVEQLQESIRFDCGYEPAEPARVDGAAWLASEIKDASDDVAHHAKRRAEEIARTTARNEWLAALRANITE